MNNDVKKNSAASIITIVLIFGLVYATTATGLRVLHSRYEVLCLMQPNTSLGVLM